MHLQRAEDDIQLSAGPDDSRSL